MLKRTLAIFMAVFMLLGVLAGCGKGEDENKKVELIWYTFIGEQSELRRANDYINEELAKVMPNTTLKIVEDPGFAAKWSMWMASDEAIDISWTGYMVSMQTEVEADSYLPLDDLIDKYGDAIKAEAKEFNVEYETGKYQGTTYAIPNLQPIMTLSPGLAIPPELYEYFDTDAFVAACKSSTKLNKGMLDVIDRYFDKAFASGKIDNDTVSNHASISSLFDYIATRGYDWVGTARGDLWMCYDAFDDNAKIVSFFETDEYKLMCEYAAKWKEKGYVPEDIMMNNDVDSRTSVLSAYSNGMPFNTVEGNDHLKKVFDADGKEKQVQVLVDSLDQKFLGTNSFGSLSTYTCLPHTCRNPERAIKLINLLKTDEGTDLFNAIVYGIEGRHYTLKHCDEFNDYVAYGVDYTIQPERDSLYGIPHWEIGNVYRCYRTPNILDGQKEFCLDYINNIRPTLHKTKYYNFQPQTKSLTIEYQNCNTVIGEHSGYLSNGVEGNNWKKKYDTMMKELKDNGLEKVKTELTEQAKAK